MRFSSAAAIAVATSFAMVAAQDLSSIPTCAIPCFAAAVAGSGCGLSDTKCQCTTGNAKITESITGCAPGRCGAEDLAKIAPAAAGLCAAAGVTVSVAPASSAMASMASSAPAMMSSAAGSMSSMAGGAMSSAMSQASGMMSSATASAPAQATTNAAAQNIVGYGAAAAMAVALAL